MGRYFTFTKTYNAGDTSQQWSDKVDAALHGLAVELREAGWLPQYRNPYAKVQTTGNMSGFAGSAGLEEFWGVYPADFISPGNPRDVKLVIDVVPPSWSPPPGYELFEVTGTGDKAVVHEAIVRALQSYNPDLENIGSDPNDPEPNTLLKYNLTAEGIVTDYILPQAVPIGGTGTSLNTNVGVAAKGGYACATQANTGNESVAMYLSRTVIGGIDPNGPQICLAGSIPPQPIEFNLEENVTRTPFFAYQITKADYVAQATPYSLILSQVSDGLVGHLEIASLELPVEESLIVEATMAVGSADVFLGTSFRGGPNCSGVARYARNGVVLYTAASGIHAPRIMSLWTDDTNGTPWLNGNAQDTEPWIAFNVVEHEAAPILGKFPGVLVLNAMRSASDAPFKFDNRSWRVFSDGVTLTGNRNCGTLCVEIDEETDDPDCP